MKSTRTIFILLFVSALIPLLLFFSWLSTGNRFTISEINTEDADESCRSGDKTSGLYAGSITGHQIPEISITGNPDAPVTITEFSDFLCPHCRSAYELLKTVIENSDGIAKLVFVNLPLDTGCNRTLKVQMHKGSCMLAKGGICASIQNRFTEYQETVFALKQTGSETDGLRMAAIYSGLNIPEFTACLAKTETDAELKKQLAIAEKLNINSVPAVFINGKRISTWNDRELLENEIRNELIKSGKNKLQVN